MVLCSICKQNKETRNRWVIHEHGSDKGLIREFKVCDGCAASVVKKVLEEMKTDSDSGQLNLMRSGILDTIALSEDNSLEITLSMDLAKARKVILEQGVEEPAPRTQPEK
jgi:hypothetical protein